MNKDLQSEELDRELVQLNYGPAFCDVNQVKVGKRTLTFYQNRKHVHDDFKNEDTRITFLKSNNCGQSLAFKVEWNEFNYKVCSLGHKHQELKANREYTTFHLDWSHVDQLIEWIQAGSWSQVCNRKDPKDKVLQKAFDLFSALETQSENKFLKAEISKTKSLITSVLKYPTLAGTEET